MNAWLSFSSQSYLRFPSDHLVNLHKLCVYFLRQTEQFSKIFFIVDKKFYPYFKKVNFDEFFVDSFFVPKGYEQVWSLPKIYASRFICGFKEPFLHIDYDVQLRKPLSDQFLFSDVLTQCPENCEGNSYELKKFQKHCPSKHCLENYLDKEALNVGIFGGQKIDFIEAYTNKAIDFVLDPKNKWFWTEYDGYEKNWAKAVLAEQYFLKGFSDQQGQQITTLFPGWPIEEEALQIGYIHLMSAKNNLDVVQKTKQLVAEYGL